MPLVGYRYCLVISETTKTEDGPSRIKNKFCIRGARLYY